MTEKIGPVEAALRGGSRAKNVARKITELCSTLPDDPDRMTDAQRKAVLRLAAVCRATKAAAAAMAFREDVPAICEVPEFADLFCVTYFPVLEEGKRTVGFWSVKDQTVLSADDVHEWVRDTAVNKKTGKSEEVPVPFGTWWGKHRPDYTLYGVAADRAAWKEIIIDAEGRKCVNTLYGKAPVLTEAPKGYGDGSAAATLLQTILERTITDPNEDNASAKRQKFVLDAGAHLLALRDGGGFRCRKLFCFASTNNGQGSGKSVLQESLAALVPRDASCTVPTTALAFDNLLPLYASSVCILTEAPSTASEKYTAEDIKAFADAGWKTAQEKYIAKRSVRDNSLKMLSSNHLSPLPIDSVHSRRIEFFESVEIDDGGGSLRALLDAAQEKNGWSVEELRACVGWALLARAQRYLDEGAVPFAVARRTIAPKHLLTTVDYDYLVTNGGNVAPSYSDYRDFRTDRGVSWSPDRYRFEAAVQMSKGSEMWIDDVPPPKGPKDDPPAPPEDDTEEQPDDGRDDAPADVPEAPVQTAPAAVRLQYKRRMATMYLEQDTLSLGALYAYIIGDAQLKAMTEAVRAGTAEKKMVLRQVFPGAAFNRFSRSENIVSFTGLTHVDFDHVSEHGNGLTAGQVRDALSEMPGFVIGGVSSRGDGAWAIFNAGNGVVDYPTYEAASRSLFSAAEEKVSMKCDTALRLPTAGRTLGHDADCRIADEAIAGLLPEPYYWKAATYGVKGGRLAPTMNDGLDTPDRRVRNERFMEAVVAKSCEKIQNAGNGERHDTAIRSVSNVILCAEEKGIVPLSSWGRQLREACVSCGLPTDEVNSIMSQWRKKTGLQS